MVIAHMGEQVLAIADELLAPEAGASVRTILDRLDRDRGDILILGSPGVGRTSFVQAVLGVEGILPVSAIPKGEVRIRIVPGEATSLTLVERSGRISPLSLSDLQRIQSDTLTPADFVRVTLGHDLKRAIYGCDLTIEPLPGDFDKLAWLSKLATFDALFVLISAQQALTDQEQSTLRFLTDLTGASFPVTIVVTHCDQLPDRERDQVMSRVGHFVAHMPEVLRIIPFSAAIPEHYTPDLHEIRDQFNASVATRYPRGLALMRIAAEELVAVTDLRIAQVTMMESLRQSGALSTAERAKFIKRRINQLDEWIEIEIGLRLIEEIIERSHRFSVAICDVLPDEIRQVNNVDLLRRHGTSYLTTIWESFAEEMFCSLEPSITAIIDRLNAAITRDLVDLSDNRLGETTSYAAFPEYMAPIAAFLPGRAHSAGRSVSTFTALFGAGMLVSASIPYGLIALGLSVGIRSLTAPAHRAKTTQQVIIALQAANEELEEHWVEAASRAVNDLVVVLSEETTRIYTTALERLNKTSADHLQEDDRVHERIFDLEAMRDSRLPELIAQITAELDAHEHASRT